MGGPYNVAEREAMRDHREIHKALAVLYKLIGRRADITRGYVRDSSGKIVTVGATMRGK